MKYLLILFTFTSLLASAQSTYQGGNVSINLSDTTNDAGVAIKRRAFFRTMIYNFYNNTIDIQVDIYLYDGTGNTRLRRWVTPITKNFTITNDEYVRVNNGNLVGNWQQLHDQFGVVKRAATDSTPIVYWKSSVPGNLDSLTTPCIGRYDYYLNLFDGTGTRLHQDVIRNLMNKANAEGKLD